MREVINFDQSTVTQAAIAGDKNKVQNLVLNSQVIGAVGKGHDSEVQEGAAIIVQASKDHQAGKSVDLISRAPVTAEDDATKGAAQPRLTEQQKRELAPAARWPEVRDDIGVGRKARSAEPSRAKEAPGRLSSKEQVSGAREVAMSAKERATLQQGVATLELRGTLAGKLTDLIENHKEILQSIQRGNPDDVKEACQELIKKLAGINKYTGAMAKRTYETVQRQSKPESGERKTMEMLMGKLGLR